MDCRLASTHQTSVSNLRFWLAFRDARALSDGCCSDQASGCCLKLLRGQWQHNRTSILDEFKPYLDERWDEGCTNAWKLWEEIVPLGHRGSYGRVSAYL
ncbi:hypothetical protein ACFZCT_31800 [Streptomyces qaidamensis]|uniref:hypothetical protein n=1 Tax=Streptomyces qaidamensis TaxID=1783515 RepID=UPI0036E87809